MSKMRFARLLLAGLIAAIAMSWATGQASASRGFSVTNGIALWIASGNLTLRTASLDTICNWQIGARPNSSIAKVLLAEILVILLSGAGSSLSTCNLGITGIIVNGVRVGYTGYVGSLPNIEAILGRSNNFAFLIVILGMSCLYRGSVDFRFNRNLANGEIVTIAISALNTLIAPAGCPSPASLNGTLTVQPTRPVVRLI